MPSRMVEPHVLRDLAVGTIVHVYSDLNPNKHVKETLDAVKALKK